MTGWAYDEIVYSLPFAVGLQIIHAEDASKGRSRPWKTRAAEQKIDALTIIEQAFT